MCSEGDEEMYFLLMEGKPQLLVKTHTIPAKLSQRTLTCVVTVTGILFIFAQQKVDKLDCILKQLHDNGPTKDY